MGIVIPVSLDRERPPGPQRQGGQQFHRHLLIGLGHLVKGCTAVRNASQGIFVEGGTISGNVASQNGTGIKCTWGSVIGNTVLVSANQKVLRL